MLRHSPMACQKPLFRLGKSHFRVRSRIRDGPNAKEGAGDGYACSDDGPVVPALARTELRVPLPAFSAESFRLQKSHRQKAMSMRISVTVRRRGTLDIDPDGHAL